MSSRSRVYLLKTFVAIIQNNNNTRINRKEVALMTTNPAGKGTKTIGINMKLEMAMELERRAASMQLSTGAYCKIILGEWIRSGQKLKLQEN